MSFRKTILFVSMSLIAGSIWGQDTINPQHIPTLNRIATEYDTWKWVIGIATAILAIWSFFGLRYFIKAKAEEWVLKEIEKEAGLKVEHLKDALAEYARVVEIKKKKILVLSAAEGQQNNVKKILDQNGFTELEWEDISKAPTLVLQNVKLLIINDQPELPVTQTQIDQVIEKFGKNVACLYFGPKHPLPIAEYRKQNPLLNLGLCNSADRLETGILSLLKIA